MNRHTSALAFTDKWLSTNPEAESDSGRSACEFDLKKMPGVGWRSTCAGVMAGRVPRRVPLNSISVVSGVLSELCDQQLTDSKKASKVRIPPSPPFIAQ
jgi:hypothetical protein